MKWLRVFLPLIVVLGIAASMRNGGPHGLFVGGRDWYPTYRIPALAVTNSGVILAFCEARRTGIADHGDLDLVVKRSSDGGVTWGKMQVIKGDGFVTWGNPAPVVDRSTGVVSLLFCLNNDRVFVTSSQDEGATWTEPVEITSAVKPAGWGWYATGPGHGIQLASGRLLIPCDHREPGEFMRSHVIYSDDHGATWKLGGSLPEKTDESMAVEVNGRVYLSMRNVFGLKRRAYAWSDDGGLTWSEPKTDPALVDPTCQASIVAYPGGKLLFLNPASEARENMSLRVSDDGAATWGPAHTIHAGPAAYSDLAVLPDGDVVILFENGKRWPYDRISFQRIPAETITGLSGK